MAYNDYSYHDRRPRDPYVPRTRESDYGYTRYDDYTSSYTSSPQSSSYSYAPSHYPRTSSSNYTSSQYRWPPSPSVEDEDQASLKEYNYKKSKEDEVPLRGTIDGDLMEEVESRDQRYVVADREPELRHDGGRDALAREREERRSRRRERVPAVDTNLEDRSRRAPSPYAYAKPTQTTDKRSSGEKFLSPESVTESRHDSTPRSVPSNAIPPKLHPERSSTNDSDNNSVFDDSDYELDPSLLKNTRRPARYSFAPNENSREDLSDIRTSLNNARINSMSSSQHSTSRPKDSTGSANSSRASSPARDRQQKVREKLPAYPPRPPTSNPYGDSSHSSKASSAIPSTPKLKNAYPPSPPRTPYEEPKSFNKPTSKPPTKSSSRPDSPSYPYNSASDLPSPPRTSDGYDLRDDRHNSKYPNVDTRTRPEPRVPSSLRHDTLPPPTPTVKVQSPSSARKATNLPYPENDLAYDMMPTPDSYVPRLPQIDTKPNPKIRQDLYSRPPSPAQETPKSPRPSIKSRRTADSTKPDRSGSGSDSDSRRKQREAPALFPKCPRTEYSTRYDDWYAMSNRQSFAICPTCYDYVIAPTKFAAFFHRSPKMSRNVSIKCDFSSPWTRMAWLMTQRQNRRNLDLLENIADIVEREKECPGEVKMQGTWYGLLANDRTFVKDLYICPFDVQQLEALFPYFVGVFTRIPQHDTPRTPHRCSMRTTGPRFIERLDTLHALHEQLQNQGGGRTVTDMRTLMRPFVNLFPLAVEPCQRDNLMYDHEWYLIERLPEFTVCAECYHAYVQPLATPGSLAHEFHPDPILLSKKLDRHGNSCQLYSPRMRKIWKDAERANDFSYLISAVLERKKREMELQDKMRTLRKQLDRAQQARDSNAWRGYQDVNMPGSPMMDEQRIRWDIQDLIDNWKRWE